MTARPGRLLRGLFKLVVVVAIAAAIGGAIGIGLSELSGNSKPSAPSPGAAPASTAAAGVAGSGTAAGGSAPGSGNDITVEVIDAALHPAGSASGRRRNRARLTVRVRARNGGATAFTPQRPVLAVGNAHVRTDPSADGPRTNLTTLQPGQSASVTLRFELAGAVTTQVRSQRRARVLVAGHVREKSVKIGQPLRPGG